MHGYDANYVATMLYTHLNASWLSSCSVGAISVAVNLNGQWYVYGRHIYLLFSNYYHLIKGVIPCMRINVGASMILYMHVHTSYLTYIYSGQPFVLLTEKKIYSMDTPTPQRKRGSCHFTGPLYGIP